jgi:hypothetical protein
VVLAEGDVVRRALVVLVGPVALLAAARTSAAAAVESLPFATLTPADGAVFAPSTKEAIPFALRGGPASAISVTVRVSTTPDVEADGRTLADASTADYFALTESTVSHRAYAGVSDIGPTEWTSVAGTYYWQVRAHWVTYAPDTPALPPDEFTYHSHIGVGPIRRITIRKTSDTATLRSSRAIKEARAYLRGSSTSFRRGSRRRLRCSRVSLRVMACRATWRYRGAGYVGRVRVVKRGVRVSASGIVRRR